MEEITLRMLNEKQTAQMLSVSVAALRRWRRENRGPAYTRCERCIRYDIRSIEKFLNDNSSANRKVADSQSTAKRGMHISDATIRR
jgi:hypothetical protein